MFKVGDSVRILNCCPSHYIGTIGTVTKTDTSYNEVYVEAFDGQKLVFYFLPDLELINKSPVQTVTRREIVPGVYGLVEIDNVTEEGVSIWLPVNKRWNANELKSMIDTLQQIVSVFEENE